MQVLETRKEGKGKQEKRKRLRNMEEGDEKRGKKIQMKEEIERL